MEIVLESHNSLGHVENPREEIVVKDQIEVALNLSSLAPCKSFLRNGKCIEEETVSGLYRNLIFEPSHDFNLMISKLSKACTMTFQDSNKEVTKEIWLDGSTRAVRSMKTAPLNFAATMLAAAE